MLFPACVLGEALPEPGEEEKLPGATRQSSPKTNCYRAARVEMNFLIN